MSEEGTQLDKQGYWKMSTGRAWCPPNMPSGSHDYHTRLLLTRCQLTSLVGDMLTLLFFLRGNTLQNTFLQKLVVWNNSKYPII